MFEVLHVDQPGRARSEPFMDADEARKFAVAYKADTGKRVRLNKIVNEVWRKREESRLRDGIYQPLPRWFTEMEFWQESKAPRLDHYTHMAKDGVKIAFTESPVKGDMDIQLAMAVSSYLGRYFPNLPGDEISRIAGQFGVEKYQMKISMKPDDFERIYSGQNVRSESSGHESCMKYDKDHFGTAVHPARVFGGGDLAIAWIEDPDQPFLHVLARANIWPEQKTYIRIYSRAESFKVKLEAQLRAQGYKRADNFDGAKLLRIVHATEHGRELLVVPYSDGNHHTATDTGEHLVIARRGDVDLSTTEGKAWSNRPVPMRCEKTGFEMMSNQAVMVNTRRGTQQWCAEAVNQFAYVCPCAGGRWSTADYPPVSVVVDIGNGVTEQWCPAQAETYSFLCQKTNLVYSRGNYNRIRVRLPNGTNEIWCDCATINERFRCGECGIFFANVPADWVGLCQPCGRQMVDVMKVYRARNNLPAL